MDLYYKPVGSTVTNMELCSNYFVVSLFDFEEYIDSALVIYKWREKGGDGYYIRGFRIADTFDYIPVWNNFGILASERLFIVQGKETAGKVELVSY